MKNFFKIIPLIITTFFCCSSNQDVETEINLTKNSAFEAVALSLINKHRASKKLAKLKVLDALKKHADSHTAFMISQNKISHNNFDSRGKEILKEVKASNIAENVASGYTTPESLVNGWLKSDSHRKNIEGDFTHFNLSAKKNSSNTWYFTNIFVKINSTP